MTEENVALISLKMIIIKGYNLELRLQSCINEVLRKHAKRYLPLQVDKKGGIFLINRTVPFSFFHFAVKPLRHVA